jgi:phytoene dehydrogenase-like protein
MGSISNELAHAARSAGVTIRTGQPVKRIIISNGRATGVETEAGETFESLMVISNADPKTTLMKLIGAKHAETGFARRISHLRAKGNAAKLHLALDGLPLIEGLR